VRGPFVWRIVFRIVKEEEGVTDCGMLLLLLLLLLLLRELICSSTTLYIYIYILSVCAARYFEHSRFVCIVSHGNREGIMKYISMTY